MRRANQKPNLILNSLDRRGGASPSSALIGGGVLSRNQSEVKGRGLGAGAGRGAAGQSLPPRARTDRARPRSATVRPQPGLLGSGRRLGPRVVHGEQAGGRGSGRAGERPGEGGRPERREAPRGLGRPVPRAQRPRVHDRCPLLPDPRAGARTPHGGAVRWTRVPPAPRCAPDAPLSPAGAPRSAQQ